MLPMVLRESFVVAEISLAIVLLLGAGLMLRSFARARSIDPGFQAENVVTGRVGLPLTKYPAAAGQRTRFFEEAERRLTALPGVTAVGASPATCQRGARRESSRFRRSDTSSADYLN